MNKIIKSGYVCEGIICESIDVDNKVFYLKQNGINYRYKPDIDISEINSTTISSVIDEFLKKSIPSCTFVQLNDNESTIIQAESISIAKENSNWLKVLSKDGNVYEIPGTSILYIKHSVSLIQQIILE